MFAHIQIGARDVDGLVGFYDAVLGQLRICRAGMSAEAETFWRKGDDRWPQFVVREPFDGLPATWGNGTQISFLAHSRACVDRAWTAALANGDAMKEHRVCARATPTISMQRTAAIRKAINSALFLPSIGMQQVPRRHPPVQSSVRKRTATSFRYCFRCPRVRQKIHTPLIAIV